MKNSPQVHPLISIISPSYNQGEFMEDCIGSILKQTFKNWEHIVIDGKSTDNSVSILKKFKHIRWISEKDNGYWHAITKGVKIARGKYIMICMISDGYINKNWLKECAAVLEKDKEVSLVWGIPRWLEDGKLTDECYVHFRHTKVPQKFDWLPYWLLTGEALPNGNFCIHKKIFEKCNEYPKDKVKGRELYNFNYNFNTRGYLPYHIHEVADFCRAHSGQIGESWTANGWLPGAVRRYYKQIADYYMALKDRRINQIFRDSSGVIIQKNFKLPKLYNLSSFLMRQRIKFLWIMQRGPRKLQKIVMNKIMTYE